MCVNLCQLPHQDHYTLGLHVVVSILRLAAAKLHAAAWSTNPEPAVRAHSTRVRSDNGESSKDAAWSASSADSRASSSSEHHAVWPQFSFLSEKKLFNVRHFHI